MSTDAGDPRLTAIALGEDPEAQGSESAPAAGGAPETAAEVADIRRLGDLLREAYALEENPGLTPAAREAVAAAALQGPARGLLQFPRTVWLLLSGAAAACVVGGILLRNLNGPTAASAGPRTLDAFPVAATDSAGSGGVMPATERAEADESAPALAGFAEAEEPGPTVASAAPTASLPERDVTVADVESPRRAMGPPSDRAFEPILSLGKAPALPEPVRPEAKSRVESERLAVRESIAPDLLRARNPDFRDNPPTPRALGGMPPPGRSPWPPFNPLLYVDLRDVPAAEGEEPGAVMLRFDRNRVARYRIVGFAGNSFRNADVPAVLARDAVLLPGFPGIALCEVVPAEAADPGRITTGMDGMAGAAAKPSSPATLYLMPGLGAPGPDPVASGTRLTPIDGVPGGVSPEVLTAALRALGENVAPEPPPAPAGVLGQP